MNARVVSVIGALLFCGSALGQVTVVVTGSGSASPANPDAGQAITLTATGNATFKVYANSATDIGALTLWGSGNVDVLVGSSGAFPSLQTLEIGNPLAASWAGLALDSGFNGVARVACSIAGDLTGSVTADQVFRLEVGRDLGPSTGSLVVRARSQDRADPLAPSAVGPILVGRSFLSTAQIDASAVPSTGAQATIVSLGVGTQSPTTALFAGSISTMNGRIGNVLSAVPIDNAGIPVTILAKRGITSIIAPTINANITANANGGDGAIQYVEATRNNPSPGQPDPDAGELRGSLIASGLRSLGGESGLLARADSLMAVTINGDVDAPIYVAGDLNNTIVVNGDVMPLGSIRVEGMKGAQILISGDASSITIDGALDPSVIGFEPSISVGGTLAALYVGSNVEQSRRLVAGTFGDVYVGGNFLGSIDDGNGGRVRMNNLLVGGDVIGGVLRVTDYDSIRIRGSVFNGASEARIELDRVPTFSHFSIGGSLSSPLVVDGVNGALQGHLAVNTLSGNVLLTLPNVYVRNESGQVVTLSPGGAYAQPSCDLGGGVIGTVPFRPYVSTNPSCDSGPTQPYGQTLPPVMLQSEFSQLRSLTANIPGRGIRVVFYGRVAMTGAMNGRPTWPVTLEWLQPQLNQWITVDNSQWRLVAADGAPDTLPVRQVVVFMNPALSLAAMMPAGQYRIRLLDDPITPGARRLYCWDEFANNNVAANSVYVAAFNTDRVLCQFEVRRDCNGDGVEDEVGDCGGTQNGRCVSDVDNDGSFSNGLTPDHAVTVDDLIAFLAAFEAGSVLVDMDDGSGTGQADGGIGIGDLLYFLYWFEVGC